MTSERIPCFIIACNLLTWLKDACDQAVRLQLRPVIFDQASTYKPLLYWYETDCPYQIIQAGYNGGPHGFWISGLAQEQTGPFVLTDPDLDLSSVPDDAVLRLQEALGAFPEVRKAALSLEINDLPPNCPDLGVILGWERQYWEPAKLQTRDGVSAYVSRTDSTFALYHPERFELDYYTAVRLPRPYTARHRPWYLLPGQWDEEYKFYLQQAQHLSMMVFTTRNRKRLDGTL